MEIQHTQQCLDAREKERAQLAAYEKEYPNYCRKRGGEGGHPDWEYRGECHGISASEQVCDYCQHCIEQKKCPRCGDQETNFTFWGVIEDGLPMVCFACGWKEGDPGAPEVLNPYDCGCFEDLLDAAQVSERELFRPLQEQY